MTKSLTKCKTKDFDNTDDQTFEQVEITEYICVPDGTLANPSIRFCDDKDTGIYRVSSDLIGVTKPLQIAYNAGSKQIEFDADAGSNTEMYTDTSSNFFIDNKNASSDIRFELAAGGEIDMNAPVNVNSTLTVDTDSATAFLVQDTASHKVFSVDSAEADVAPANLNLIIHTPVGTNAAQEDAFIYFDDAKTAYIKLLERSGDSINQFRFKAGTTGELILNDNGFSELSGSALTITRAASTEAFRIRTDTGGTKDIITVDTTNSLINIGDSGIEAELIVHSSNNNVLKVEDNSSTEIFNVNSLTPHIKLAGGLSHTVSSETGATYTILADDYLVNFTNTGGTAVEVTLPAASAHNGRELILVNRTTNPVAVNINRAGSDTIDDSSTTVLVLTTTYDKTKLISDGVSVWFSI